MTPDADPLTIISQTAAERAVLTAGSSAWGRGAWRTPPLVPVLLLEADHHVARTGIRTIRTRLDRFAGASRIGGLWVAGMPRTIVDECRILRSRPDAAVAIADMAITADRLRLMPVDDLIAMVDEPCQFHLPTRVPTALQ